MARLHIKTKNRGGKATYRCERCGAKIKPAETYYEWTTRSGRRAEGVKHRRCHRHKPRPSEMTKSEHKQVAYAAQEAINDAVSTFNGDHDHDALKDALEGAKGELEEHLGTIEERISNMETSFPNGCPALDTLNEYKDGFEQFIESIEDAINTLESFDWSATVEFEYDRHSVSIEVSDARDVLTDAFDFDALDFEVSEEQQEKFLQAANESREQALTDKVNEAAQAAEETECPI